jgi:propionate CoA-transferase
VNLLTKAGLVAHIIRWRLTWSVHDSDWREPGATGPKFITARQAAERIPDGATCISSGLAANARCSAFYWAIRERFLREGRPKGLTWLSNGAQGGRGRAPGTIEELGLPGLITRMLTGHWETKKSLLKLADQGLLEMHTMPQGQFSFLLEAQARGEETVEAVTGVGTFLDPRCGTGSCVRGTPRETFIEPAGDGRLRFRLPRIDVAMFNVPYADAEGNLYVRNAAMLTETLESAMAARRNGGLVMASVSGLVPKNEKEIYLRADQVDAIVVNPGNEQTGSIPQRRYWKLFTPHSDVTEVEGALRLRFANDVLKITPVRTPVDLAMARMAARLFTRISHRGALVNIGVGHPEEVCRQVFEGGLTRDVQFMTETGVIGGLPAPGIFFGAAINPRELITSAAAFHRCYESLDTTILGVLQADSEGNINVSKRGPRASDYVGPGGLPDLTAAARHVLFVGSWMAHGRMAIRDGRLVIEKRGTPKFIAHVDEVTFSGRQALAMGKDVWYATNVGVFHLTPRGMELVEVMPGIDPVRDVVDGNPMRVVLPDGGPRVVAHDVVTGEGFRLAWP